MSIPVCLTAEPTWLTSPWWPTGAVFRCGCGFAQGGTVSVWNNVTICAALGDLYYAGGGPTSALSAQPFSFAAAAAGTSPTNYCNFNYGGTIGCNFADTGQSSPLGPDAFINLQAAGLSGTLPASFTALTALNGVTKISFMGNAGLVIDPSLFAPFTGLTILSLSATKLTGTIPSSWGALSNMVTFSASDAMLSGTLPPELGLWTGLKTLSIDGNDLEGSLPDTFSSMTVLEEFYASQNALSGTLSAVMLCGMAALDTLDLKSNQLTGTIPDLSCMHRMAYLDLRNNLLTGTIRLGACVRMPSV